MNPTQMALAQKVAFRYGTLPEVEAVALAGSLRSGFGGDDSDIDIYVYCNADILLDDRQRITLENARYAEQVDYWGPGDEWIDARTGLTVDVIYFKTDWMEEQLNRVLQRHEASIGYTTCFWYTVKISTCLLDVTGWFGRMQTLARQPYPVPLQEAIISLNYPLLRQIIPSYFNQIKHALARRDWVSVNHRLAALFASYFDILFAVNLLPHPGEKRLLDFAERDCQKLPAHFRAEVESVLAAREDVLEKLTLLLNSLDDLLKSEGLV